MDDLVTHSTNERKELFLPSFLPSSLQISPSSIAPFARQPAEAFAYVHEDIEEVRVRDIATVPGSTLTDGCSGTPTQSALDIQGNPLNGPMVLWNEN